MALTVFSRRQKRQIAHTLKDTIRELMLGVAGDPFLLYEVVAAGPFFFRQTFLRTFRAYPVNDHLADLIFKFFCDQVVRRHPGGENAQQTATDVLDGMDVKAPPTAQEIERSWVHEVFSSEGGRRANYLDGAGMAGQDHKVIIRN